MIRAALLVILSTASLAAVTAAVEVSPDTQSAKQSRAADGAKLAQAAPPAGDPRPAPIPFELRPSVAQPAVRDVTPDGITAGPAVTGPLIRIAPPAPTEAPDPARQARSERLFFPLIVAADTIKLREREVRLAGIAAPSFESFCGEGIAAWPCGRMARAALRRFIRGRAVDCEVPAGAAEIPDPAECSVAGRSLSAWLVSQGWAKQQGGAFAELEADARAAKRGVWADRRPDALPGAQPAAVAANVPAGASAGVPASAPESALPMRARVSGTP
jgi:endonuclease YncB( thermonuclease family)